MPGGVTLPTTIQVKTRPRYKRSVLRYSHGELSLEDAAAAGCRACASPGGGCQFLGTAATSQVVAEAMGLTLPHAALAPSGEPIWLDMARASAHALDADGQTAQIPLKKILTPAAVRNAIMVSRSV